MLRELGAVTPLIDSDLPSALLSPAGASSATSRSRYELPVAAPFRLDLTVSALRRLSTNIVDVLTSDGDYVRAFETSRGLIIASVAQESPGALTVTLDGDPREHKPTLAVIGRMLGIDRDLQTFTRAAGGIPWLAPLAQRMRGVKPPCYPTLWEACVNAVVFQQISLQAATSIMRRLIGVLGRFHNREGVGLYAFPSPQSFLAADDVTLRDAGLSIAKRWTLRRVVEALESRTLDVPTLEELSTPDAAALLRGIKGIGPWTATVILLRGLGRLDLFPMNDTSVARNLELVSGSAQGDVESTLRSLSPQQGMLYYHLLLARLEARDELGRASLSTGIA